MINSFLSNIFLQLPQQLTPFFIRPDHGRHQAVYKYTLWG